MNNKSRQDLIENYQKSRKRLLLLDYDGTLVTFSDTPDKAKPTSQLLEILKELSLDPKNELVTISGRDRHFLNLWFGDLYIGFIAEHGAWIKTDQQRLKRQKRSQLNGKIKSILFLRSISARSSAVRISGRASRTSSSFWPTVNRLSSQLRRSATCFGSPATIKR